MECINLFGSPSDSDLHWEQRDHPAIDAEASIRAAPGGKIRGHSRAGHQRVQERILRAFAEQPKRSIRKLRSGDQEAGPLEITKLGDPRGHVSFDEPV
jgi:hypothetical protein